MPFIGDDYVTTREYRDLRQKWREAHTTTPWKKWAQHYISPAGARDRELVRRQDEVEARNKALAYAGIEAQQAAMDRELEPDPAHVRELRRRANARNEVTHDCTPDAVRAQSQLQAMGIPPRRRS
jgi:hypothetical protein